MPNLADDPQTNPGSWQFVGKNDVSALLDSHNLCTLLISDQQRRRPHPQDDNTADIERLSTYQRYTFTDWEARDPWSSDLLNHDENPASRDSPDHPHRQNGYSGSGSRLDGHSSRGFC